HRRPRGGGCDSDRDRDTTAEARRRDKRREAQGCRNATRASGERDSRRLLYGSQTDLAPGLGKAHGRDPLSSGAGIQPSDWYVTAPLFGACARATRARAAREWRSAVDRRGDGRLRRSESHVDALQAVYGDYTCAVSALSVSTLTPEVPHEMTGDSARFAPRP